MSDQPTKPTRTMAAALLRSSILPVLTLVLGISLHTAYEFGLRALLSPTADLMVSRALFVVYVIVTASWAHCISSAACRWYAENVATRTQTQLDDEFVPLFRRILAVVIWIVAGMMALSHMGVNIGALVTMLGVSSLAIALAAQDTIANIIAGFLIMIDRPFRIGDSIKLPSGERVTVQEIGIRRSKFVHAEEQSIIIVPNVDLSKSKIVNYTYGQHGTDAKDEVQLPKP